MIGIQIRLDVEESCRKVQGSTSNEFYSPLSGSPKAFFLKAIFKMSIRMIRMPDVIRERCWRLNKTAV